jgi:hypothetical protein
MLAVIAPGCKPDDQLEELEHFYDVVKMIFHAKMWGFEGTYGKDEQSWLGHFEDGDFDNMVFVMSASEAADYPDNYNVVWPTEETEGFLVLLNEHLQREGIDPTPYALSYPLTMEDVYELLLRELDSSDRDPIFRP